MFHELNSALPVGGKQALGFRNTRIIAEHRRGPNGIVIYALNVRIPVGREQPDRPSVNSQIGRA